MSNKHPLKRITSMMAMVTDKGKTKSFNWIAFMQGYDIKLTNKILDNNFHKLSKYFDTSILKNLINQCAFMMTQSNQKKIRLFNLFNGLDKDGNKVDYKTILVSTTVLYECFRISVEHNYSLFPSKNIISKSDINNDTCIDSLELIDSLYIVEKIINDKDLKQFHMNDFHEDYSSMDNVSSDFFNHPVIIEVNDTFIICFKRSNGLEIFYFETIDMKIIYAGCSFIKEENNEIIFKSVSEKDVMIRTLRYAISKTSEDSLVVIEKSFISKILSRDKSLLWFNEGKRSSIFIL